MATKIKPAFKIEPKPNFTGYQAVGSIKGKFSYLEDQTGANEGRGILKTKYGDFPAFVHVKCRVVVNLLYSKAHYFLVWFRNRLITEDNTAPLQFTIVGCGGEGVDNSFLITGALIGGNKEAKEYQFILARNYKSKVPTKHKTNFATHNFKVKVSAKDDLWGLYKRKLAALVCKIEDGKLQVISHQLVSEELPDPSILKSLRKKLKKKSKKAIKNDPTTKPLIKKKIIVGVIDDPVKTAKSVVPITTPNLQIVELPKKRC
ncbi:MAG: hypothetical protein ACKO2Z_36960 [Sphaerospermopsis kisseleviana]